MTYTHGREQSSSPRCSGNSSYTPGANRATWPTSSCGKPVSQHEQVCSATWHAIFVCEFVFIIAVAVVTESSRRLRLVRQLDRNTPRVAAALRDERGVRDEHYAVLVVSLQTACRERLSPLHVTGFRTLRTLSAPSLLCFLTSCIWPLSD